MNILEQTHDRPPRSERFSPPPPSVDAQGRLCRPDNQRRSRPGRVKPAASAAPDATPGPPCEARWLRPKAAVGATPGPGRLRNIMWPVRSLSWSRAAGAEPSLYGRLWPAGSTHRQALIWGEMKPAWGVRKRRPSSGPVGVVGTPTPAAMYGIRHSRAVSAPRGVTRWTDLVCIYESYRRVNVRWVTPLGELVASISNRCSRPARSSHIRSPRPKTMGTTAMCM